MKRIKIIAALTGAAFAVSACGNVLTSRTIEEGDRLVEQGHKRYAVGGGANIGGAGLTTVTNEPVSDADWAKDPRNRNAAEAGIQTPVGVTGTITSTY